MDGATEHVLIALVAAIPPTLAALAALVSSMRNKTAIKTLSREVNGRLTDLLAAERREGYYEGVADGLAQAAQKHPPRPPT